MEGAGRAEGGEADARRVELGQTRPAEAFARQGPPARAGEPPPADGEAPDLGGVEVWAELARHGAGASPGPAGRFESARLLGVGSTGRVYSILDRSLGRRIAVKVLDRDAVADAASLASFVGEAQLTAALKHPNVLPVLDIDVTAAGQPYFSMSQIEGRTLGEVLQESTPAARHRAIATPNAVVSIFIAIGNAVAYAHHQRIVHQDLKPDNILIGDFGEVLVLDWGCAARLDAQKPAIYGTPLYMSPEQARQERVDERSDVYCLGATLLHALLLRLPVWRDQPDAFWEAKRTGAIDPPTAAERAGAPAELLSIALKATATEPAARYASVEAMRLDLERYQAGLAVSAHRESAWRRFRRWYGANRGFFWAATVALAALAAAGSLYVRAKLFERPAWTPVLEQDFAGEPLEQVAERWAARTRRVDVYPFPDFADAAVTDRSLFTAGADGLVADTGGARVVDLLCRDGVPGDIRIEWTLRPLLAAKNLNCFIGGPDRCSGLTVHVGGFADRGLVILTRGEEQPLVFARLPEPLRLGRAYRFLLEYDDRHLRFAIDGRQLLDYVDVDAVVSPTLQQFGFDTYPINRVAYGRVTVQRRVPAQRVSPLEVADRLYQLRHWEEAELQYQGLLQAYPGSDFAAAAAYRLLRCQREIELERAHEVASGARDASAADAEHRRIVDAYRAFVARYPGSEQAPLALAELLQMQRAAPEPSASEIAELRAALKAYRGNPVLTQVLLDLGSERAKRLDQTGGSDFTSPPYPPDIAQRVDEELATMRRWSDDYGIPLVHNAVTKRAVEVLNQLGRHEQALAACAQDSQRQECLMWLGRFDEVLALDSGDERARALALTWQARYGEVVERADFPTYQRQVAAFLRGDDDARLEALIPNGDLAWARRLQDGRFEEYLAAHPVDEHGPDWGETTRVRVLVAAGHADRVLAEYRHDSARAQALIALGRFDEAVRSATWDVELSQEVAVRLLEAGKEQEARPLCERLARAPIAHDDSDRYFSLRLFPAAARAILGDAAGAREQLRSLLVDERQTFGQRCWHIVAYALGEIDDRRFLAQPSRALVESRLLLAQGLRLELAGDARAAAGRYAELLALPYHRSFLQAGERAFLEWRVRAQGLSPTPGLSLPVGIY